jgi:desampylase
MRLAISRSLLNALIADCARDPLFERCGLLLGSGATVLAVEAAANVSPDPAVAFEIAPEMLIAATRAAREQGAGVIGHYHSHPEGSPFPSARDAAAAAGDGGRYWLIVAQGAVSAWRFTGDGPVNGFCAVPLAITSADT